jgi:hypothetical protein
VNATFDLRNQAGRSEEGSPARDPAGTLAPRGWRRSHGRPGDVCTADATEAKRWAKLGYLFRLTNLRD